MNAAEYLDANKIELPLSAGSIEIDVPPVSDMLDLIAPIALPDGIEKREDLSSEQSVQVFRNVKEREIDIIAILTGLNRDQALKLLTLEAANEGTTPDKTKLFDRCMTIVGLAGDDGDGAEVPEPDPSSS